MAALVPYVKTGILSGLGGRVFGASEGLLFGALQVSPEDEQLTLLPFDKRAGPARGLASAQTLWRLTDVCA